MTTKRTTKAPKTTQQTAGGRRLGSADSYAAIAERLGVSKTLVAYWVTGKRAPTPSDAERIAAAYGVPADAWQAPGTAASTRPRRRSTPPPADRSPGVAREPLTADADNDTARLRRFIRDGLRELEADPHLSAVKRADSLKKLVDARVALDRSTGENALSMQRIVAHPEFQRVVRLVTEAIAPHAEVLAKVIAALEANP